MKKFCTSYDTANGMSYCNCIEAKFKVKKGSLRYRERYELLQHGPADVVIVDRGALRYRERYELLQHHIGESDKKYSASYDTANGMSYCNS